MRRSETIGRPRAGFALYELVVASAMLVVGLLALAGTTAHHQRADAIARAAAAATGVLADRVERVTGAACRDSAGVRTLGAVTERWRTWAADDTQHLADTARYVLPRAGARSIGLEGVVRCHR